VGGTLRLLYVKNIRTFHAPERRMFHKNFDPRGAEGGGAGDFKRLVIRAKTKRSATTRVVALRKIRRDDLAADFGRRSR